MGIAIRPYAAAGTHSRTFRISNALIVGPRRIFAFDGDSNGFTGVDIPFVRQVQIWRVLRHQVGIGETREFICGGVAGKGAGLGDDLLQRGGTEVRSARITFFLVLENGDTHTAIIRVFQAFNLAQPGRGGEANIKACGCFRLVDTMFLCTLQDHTDDIFEFPLIWG